MPLAPATELSPRRQGARGGRLGSEARRAALVAATLEVIAQEGLAAATLRRVAEQAGVTNGLIGHHFAGKQQLIQAAYSAIVAQMTAPGRAALARAGLTPRARLVAYLRANLGPDMVDPRLFAAWASFTALLHVDPEMAAIHREGYLGFRAALEPLLEAVLRDAGRAPGPGEALLLATQINALLDGLWIEGVLLPGDFDVPALARLAISGAGRILSMKLED